MTPVEGQGSVAGPIICTAPYGISGAAYVRGTLILVIGAKEPFGPLSATDRNTLISVVKTLLAN